jgi:hypothetical protein
LDLVYLKIFESFKCATVFLYAGDFAELTAHRIYGMINTASTAVGVFDQLDSHLLKAKFENLIFEVFVVGMSLWWRL